MKITPASPSTTYENFYDSPLVLDKRTMIAKELDSDTLEVLKTACRQGHSRRPLEDNHSRWPWFWSRLGTFAVPFLQTVTIKNYFPQYTEAKKSVYDVTIIAIYVTSFLTSLWLVVLGMVLIRTFSDVHAVRDNARSSSHS